MSRRGRRGGGRGGGGQAGVLGVGKPPRVDKNTGQELMLMMLRRATGDGTHGADRTSHTKRIGFRGQCLETKRNTKNTQKST